MKYNFDEIIERKNTNSLKYDFAAEHGIPEDSIPLWVADMDFKTPPEVTETLITSSKHGIFGYTEVKDDYFNAVKNWFLSGFDFEIKPQWLVKTPGVVYAVCMAIRAFTEIGDAVLIQKPVYYPFSESIIANKRKLVNNALVYKDGKYHIDFDDFEKKIVNNSVKLFILCSPHNPVGRVWTKDELIKLGDICLKHNVIVVSDEIHCDFVYKSYQHCVMASLKPEYLENTITCTAPSKTFNLAGLQISNIFIANKDIRRKFEQEIVKTGYSQHNTMGLVSCQTAYEYGREWVNQLNEYLAENLNCLRDFLSENLPQIKLVEPQGTYLVWLDFSSLGLSEKELDDLIIHKAKLWLDKGTMFGEEGKGFQRINIACPRTVLKKALQNLKSAMI
jgi:Bifunctional PLP-dependent enzyme with beta-cystathionase and maltose regulon repressor activities